MKKAEYDELLQLYSDPYKVWYKKRYDSLHKTAAVPFEKSSLSGEYKLFIDKGGNADSHFVNIVEGAGLWGFSGVRAMARLMTEAFQTQKDTRDIIPRKGLGCVSCI